MKSCFSLFFFTAELNKALHNNIQRSSDSEYRKKKYLRHYIILKYLKYL